MIPIFDSLTHPTLTGKWYQSHKDASMQTLLESTAEQNIKGFCAVSLPDMGSDHKVFLDLVSQSDKCFAVAGIALSTMDLTKLAEELHHIKSLGYRAIKLHPRKGGFFLDADNEILNACFELAVQLDLIIFLCTYISSEMSIFPSKDPYWELVKLFKRFPKIQCVLLHGGVTHILKYADLVRFNPNLLLDLSYTIMKFKHSSLDADIRYLFSNLDQRICIGTDHPEYSVAELRHRLLDFEPYTSVEKLDNIYFQNLQSFLSFYP